MSQHQNRINIVELKERIGLLHLSDAERDFILDCINEATEPEPAPTGSVTALLDPGYELARIEHVWAYLSTDNNGEGIAAAPLGPLPLVPLIAADEARMRSIRPLAEQIARVFQRPVRLVKFTQREDVEFITP